VDLRTQYPRSPREQLDGMDILARAIDKAQAEIEGTIGEYIYWNCPMNNMLFETLGVTAERFLEAVREARHAASPAAHDFLVDARESPEDPGFLTDQQIISAVATPDVDKNIVSWIGRTLQFDRRGIAEMNARVETRAPSNTEKRYFEDELAMTGTRRTDITTFTDLVDLQEGRLGSSESEGARV